jgi:putative transposase
MRKKSLYLAEKDRAELEALLSEGELEARVFKRAKALLELDRGETLSAVARTLGVKCNTVFVWRQNYCRQGLRRLYDAPRPGRPIEIGVEQRAKITALARGAAPEGRARWSLRLLADKAVEAGFCDKISHTQVGKILKKTS